MKKIMEEVAAEGPSSVVSQMAPAARQERPEILDASVSELFVKAGLPQEIAEQAARELAFIACDNKWNFGPKNVEGMLRASQGSFAENTTGGVALFNAFQRSNGYNREACLNHRRQVVETMKGLGLLDDHAEVKEGLISSAASRR